MKMVICVLITVLGNNQNHTLAQENIHRLHTNLNNNNVSFKNVIQDSVGYIWIAHENGLLKYNGKNYESISSADIFQENDDRIKKIDINKKGTIWILSENGEIYYRNKVGHFATLKIPNQNKIQDFTYNRDKIWLATRKGLIFSVSNTSHKIDSITMIPGIESNNITIEDMLINAQKSLLVTTNHGHLYEYSTKDNELLEIRGKYNEANGSLKIAISEKNKLWITSEYHGLFCFNLNSREFIKHSLLHAKEKLLRNKKFASILVDSHNNIWIGTDGNGLIKINFKSNNMLLLKNDMNNNRTISGNTIVNIYEDSKKNIWLTNNHEGINVIFHKNDSIYSSTFNKDKPSKILSILKTSQNDIWLGSAGDGAKKISLHINNQTSSLKKQEFSKRFYIFSMFEDKKGNIWFGTYKNGLWKYNPDINNISKFEVKNNLLQLATEVRCIFKDSQQRIWIATNIGVHIYTENFNLITSFANNSNGLNGIICDCITEDHNKTIWLGYQQGGLFKFHENKRNITGSYFSNHQFISKKYKSELANSIRSLKNDSEGALWIINRSGNLIQYIIKNGKHKVIYPRSSTFKISFKNVVVENADNIWLSSDKGIWNYSVQDSSFVNFTINDGLPTNHYHGRSAFKSKDGYMYFSSIIGSVFFKPNELKKRTITPELHINQIEILNQDAIKVIPNQINKPIENIKSIKLKHHQSSFSFKFSVVDPPISDNYLYSYRLSGIYDEWVPAKNNLIATYTNIPTGNYKFEVKAESVYAKLEPQIRTIDINILTPWWQSKIAFLVYLILIITIIYSTFSYFQIKNRLAIKDRVNQQNKKLFDFKMNFLTRISHEIQTPLTLIMCPLEELISSNTPINSQDLKRRLSNIYSNSKRLSQITYKLTEIANSEFKKIQLNIERHNIISDFKETLSSFNELARIKKINFSQQYEDDELTIWYDKEKLEYIIYNLLSNAFKFTPPNGFIKFDLNHDAINKKIKFSIEDSGGGIPKTDIDNIFKLYFQSTKGKKKKGSGIGLTFTKELIELHHGSMYVKTNETGTTFTVEIPTDKNIYHDNEIVQTVLIDSLNKEDSHIETIISQNSQTKTILIVEDDYELIIMLSRLLEPYYKIITASNGKEGIQKAKKVNPNLILSDIIMPEMDGIKMCQEISGDNSLSHIPIILLTASNTSNMKLLGLEAGAVEYLNKPFYTKELLSKINNLINTQEKAISKYKKNSLNNPDTKTPLSKDEIFIDELVKILSQEIDNSNFNLEELSEKLNMSYSVIYRKHHLITGKTLVNFFRQMRLKKAAYIITKQNYSITETAFMVGYNDPVYFSKSFKKEFGVSPKAFKSEAIKMGIDSYLKTKNID
ncbi:MAG: two-component regulator propeller domain-containing protein [Bacteroidales bacterium]